MNILNLALWTKNQFKIQHLRLLIQCIYKVDEEPMHFFNPQMCLQNSGYKPDAQMTGYKCDLCPLTDNT